MAAAQPRILATQPIQPDLYHSYPTWSNKYGLSSATCNMLQCGWWFPFQPFSCEDPLSPGWWCKWATFGHPPSTNNFHSLHLVDDIFIYIYLFGYIYSYIVVGYLVDKDLIISSLRLYDLHWHLRTNSSCLRMDYCCLAFFGQENCWEVASLHNFILQ